MPAKGLTHAELVALAARWLRDARRCCIVLTELVSGRETADAIGWRGAGYASTLVECKTSRADFKRDAKKWFRINPAAGMGAYRYYLAPSGMLAPGDLPAGWGLLTPGMYGVQEQLPAGHQPEYSARAECGTLISAIRRLDPGLGEHTSIRVSRYTVSTKSTAGLWLTTDADDDADNDDCCGDP